MLPTPKEIQALRTRTDDVVLEKLDQQVTELQTTHDTVKEALDAAKATYDEVDAELRVALAQRDGFRQGLLDQRRVSLARRRPNLPAEVLSNCFEQFCWAGDPLELSFGLEAHPNAEISRAPFTLAAVCKRWRAIALATSALWCYVGLLDMPKHETPATSASIAYVVTVLERSGSFPLAIIITWKNTPDIDKRVDCTAILDMLASQAARWYRVSIAVSAVRGTWIEMFRYPTPKLRVLNCTVYDGNAQWNRRTRYLPVAPKLEMLRVSWFPLLPAGPLPLLRIAYLWLSKAPAPMVWGALSRAPRLESVLLDVGPTDTAAFSPSTLTLAEMSVLYVRSSIAAFLSTYCAHLRCPNLTVLNCAAAQLAPLEPFLQEHGGNVTELTIFQGAVAPQALATLRLLPKVARLRFSECTIASDFWDAFRDGTEVAAPLLKTLRFSAVELDADHDGLPRFVRARRFPAETADAGARLECVEFEKVGNLPTWFVAEIKYILEEK